MKAAAIKERLPIEIHCRDRLESDLHARLLLLEEEDKAFLLVQLELTSVQMYVVDHLKNQLAKELEMDPEQIWITVSHTFSAPHTRSLQAMEKDPRVKQENMAFCSMLYDHVLQAARKLKPNLQEANIHAWMGSARANVNRDLPGEDGWWKGENPKGFSSPDLPVLLIEDLIGNRIALLTGYDMQSSWMQSHSSEPVISGDIFGKAMADLESASPGMVCLLLFSSGGDQMPKSSFASAQEAASVLTAAIQAVIDTSPKVRAAGGLQPQTRSVAVQTKYIQPTHEITPKKAMEWQPLSVEELQIHTVQIGNVQLIGLAPELNSIIGHTLRHTLKADWVLAASMVNGCTKYLPDAESYGRITYEAQNSRYMPKTAETMVSCLQQAGNKMKLGNEGDGENR